MSAQSPINVSQINTSQLTTMLHGLVRRQIRFAGNPNVILSKRQKRNMAPLFIWGPPGIGKSECVNSMTEFYNCKVYDLRLSQISEVDLRGVPHFVPSENKMAWAQPVDLPSAAEAALYDVVILFLDEMNQAQPAVAAACYQLLNDRKVGTYTLPNNVVVLAAGNRQCDGGISYRMATPIANRCSHVELKPDFDCWYDWAVGAQVSPKILGYLEAFKGSLYKFDAKSGDVAFATPRSWTFVDNVLCMWEDGIITESIARVWIDGCIGTGLSAEFFGFLEVYGKMPKASDILAGVSYTMPAAGEVDISAYYALNSSMLYELTLIVEKHGYNSQEFTIALNNWANCLLDHYKVELGVAAVTSAVRSYKLKTNANLLARRDDFTNKFGKAIIKAQSQQF